MITFIQSLQLYLRKHGANRTIAHAFQKLYYDYLGGYTRWFKRHTSDASELDRQRCDNFSRPCLISVIIPVYNASPVFLRELADSLLAQSYSQWEACLFDGGSTEETTLCELRRIAASDPRFRVQFAERNGGISENTNAAVSMARGEYLAFCDHDDLYTPDALYYIRKAIDTTSAELIYSDEDKIKGKRLFDPHLKPDFSPDLLCSCNYICHLMVFSRALLERVGGFRPEYDGSQDYDVVLRAWEMTDHIHHIPRVLYHWRMFASSMSHSNEERCLLASQRALESHFSRMGVSGNVSTQAPYLHVQYDVDCNWPITLILWNDGNVAVTYEQIKRLLDRTDYPNVEIITYGCESAEIDIDGAAIHIISADDSLHFFARLNKMAECASGAFVCFLNVTLQPQTSHWLKEMLSHACRAHVGVVTSAIDADKRENLHSGDRLERESIDIYQGIIHNIQATSCTYMMLRRDLFIRSGGFCCSQGDEDACDTALCHKLIDSGLYNVYTPYASARSIDGL